MKYALWLVAALIAIVALVAAVGYFLPVGHQASRSVEIPSSPDRVFALISDPDSYYMWWPDADVKVAVVESLPPSKVVTRIVGETAFGGTWTMEVVPTPGGSRLTITERGEVYNVIFRTLSRFVFGHAATIESCLQAAQRRLASPSGR